MVMLPTVCMYQVVTFFSFPFIQNRTEYLMTEIEIFSLVSFDINYFSSGAFEVFFDTNRRRLVWPRCVCVNNM